MVTLAGNSPIGTAIQNEFGTKIPILMLGGETMRRPIKKQLNIVCLLLLLFIPAARASDIKTSLFDLRPDIKAHFTGDGPGYAVLLDENFKDNSKKWATGRHGQKGRESNFKISKGVYHMQTQVAIRPTIDLEIDDDTDFFIEACLRYKKRPTPSFKGWWDSVGIQWDGMGYSDAYDRYLSLAIDTESGIYQYGIKKTYKDPPKGDWKESTAINRGDAWNTLSVVKQGEWMHLFINGVQVETILRRNFYWRLQKGNSGPYKSHKGSRLGFVLGPELEARAKYIKVLQAPLSKPDPKNQHQTYSMFKDAEKTGRFVCKDGACLDLGTNLLWKQTGLRLDWWNSMSTVHRPMGSIDPVYDWITLVNNYRSAGFNDWRLATLGEYKTIFKSNSGIKRTDYKGRLLYTLGYLPPIKGKGIYAWVSDGTKNTVMNFRNSRVHQFDRLKRKQWFNEEDAVLVRNGPLDLFQLLLPQKKEKKISSAQQDILSRFVKSEKDIPSLTPQQVEIFERVEAAYRAGVEESGRLLFDTLVAQAPQSLFYHGYTRKIVEKNLPLKLAGKILMSVREEEKDNPLFWFEYGHLAMLANQPALIFQAAKKLLNVPIPVELKEDILNQTAVFEAAGHMLLDNPQKAYGTLLMRFELKKSLLVPYYLISTSNILLKDIKKLATLTGIDPELLTSGSYKERAPQPFYNMETGNLVEPYNTTSNILKQPENPASNKKMNKENTKTSGAVILD